LAYGTTYTFRLYGRQDGDWKLLKTIAVKAELVKITLQLDLGCEAQCITDVGVEPHGTYAAFQVKTNEPANLMIQVGTSSTQNADGTLADVHSMAVYNAGYKTSFSINVGKSLLGAALEPDTTYYYVVIAKDAQGNKARTSPVSFKTLKRWITVVYEKVYVDDDSDDLSQGDFTFILKIDGEEK
jgi:hypothetical protein